jgi:serine/threonine-protein kinase
MCTERLDDASTMRDEADTAATADADEETDELDEEEEIDEQDDSLLLDEDEGAPNLVPEEHPQRLLAGRIEILEKIGEGGMGTVWRGLHLKLERVVAVKLLDETLKLRSDARERFIREARALALLVHRNVVTIYDCDELPDGKLYLCMELLEGETLRDIIKRRQPLDPLEVIDAGLQVCDAVQTAHSSGILHRDLTPSNIIRLGDNAKTIKVIDWGLCKYLDLFYIRSTQKYGSPPGARLVTPLGCRFGNPEYMAPEMILRNNPGPPSFCTDVYALAVVLYELLTGRHPFVSGDRKLPRPVRDFLPDFEYHDLELALRAALRYRPEERTPTMAELREGLELARECLLAQRGQPAPAPASRAPVAAMVATEVEAQPVQRESVAAEPTLTQDPREAITTATVTRRPDGVRPELLSPPPPLIPLRPRGRLVPIALAAVLGLVAGIGATLAARTDERVPPTADEAPLLARLELERARASAAEQRADRCEAEAARPSRPAEPATPAPTPSQPSSPSLDQPAGRVLASSRGARRPAVSQKSPDAMARLAPKVRACARKGGITEGPITVQVRRQGGAIGSVKLLKFSKDHPSVACIDQAIRAADLPRAERPIEDFTFPL